MNVVARLVVVTPNPAVDVTYIVDEQRLSETVRVRSTTRRAGGKGLNVTRALASLRCSPLAIQPLGGPTGQWVAAELEQAGIAFATVPVPSETRTTVAVVDGSTHPTLYSEAGASLSEDSWTTLVDTIRANADSGGTVTISGSFPPETEPRQLRRLIAASRDAGARTVVDTSGPALLAAADGRADLLKPNAQELLEATGATSLEAGMQDLLARGADAVVVSRGSQGLTCLGQDGTRHAQPAVPGVSGNPTGAGDAATAGLVYSLDSGADLAEALRLASVMGAAAVLAPIAGDLEIASIVGLAARLPTASRPHLPDFSLPSTSR